MSFAATVLTLYPEMFPGPLGYSLAGRALKEGLWSINTLNIRAFATDKHRTVDDAPYGGGPGMVMKPDILSAAIEAGQKANPRGRLIYFTPRGELLTQLRINELAKNPLILLCGHFEGIDERILSYYKPLEISIGDYVLSGGEMAAFTLLDACIRLIPGVIGDEKGLAEESFGDRPGYGGLLEYPHYTRPAIWNQISVPEILQNGNHAQIEAWRLGQAQEATRARRPDLWEKYLAKTPKKA